MRQGRKFKNIPLTQDSIYPSAINYLIKKTFAGKNYCKGFTITLDFYEGEYMTKLKHRIMALLDENRYRLLCMAVCVLILGVIHLGTYCLLNIVPVDNGTHLGVLSKRPPG